MNYGIPAHGCYTRLLGSGAVDRLYPYVVFLASGIYTVGSRSLCGKAFGYAEREK